MLIGSCFHLFRLILIVFFCLDYGYAVSTHTNILIGGHRGMGETDSLHARELQKKHLAKPAENTIKSIKEALDKGVDFIEIDVIKTKDNQLAVIHSARINDHVFTNKNLGFVGMYTLRDLQNFRVGPNKDGKIPSLEEVLFLIKRYKQTKNQKLFLNIEIKDVKGTFQIKAHAPQTTLMDILIDRVHGYEDMIMFSSFSLQDLKIAKKELPNVPRAIIFDTNAKEERPLYHPGSYDPSFYRHFTKTNIVRAIEEADISYVHPELSTITPYLFECLQYLNLGINAWSLKEKRPYVQHHRIDMYLKILNGYKKSGIMTNYFVEMKELIFDQK